MTGKQARWVVLGVALLSLITWSALAGRGHEAREPARDTPDGIERVPVGTIPGGPAGNQTLIDQLADHGADLSKPRRVNHHAYFARWNEVGARDAASKLERKHFTTAVDVLDDGEWELTVTAHVVVTSSTIATEIDEITTVVERDEGDYDGWEAAVKP